MKKIKLFLLILVLTPIICAVFGIIHDQITYTISPEYYTRFKFIQFHLVDDGMVMQMDHRLGAMIVGAMATWWMGIPIALFYGIILMFFPDTTAFYRMYFRTVALTLLVTVLLSVTGYVTGLLHIQNSNGWFFPDGLIDKEHFYYVGCIHNFSYLGGTLGMMIGILYLLLQLNRKKRSSSFSLRGSSRQ